MKKINLKNILIMALALMAVTCTVAAVSADDVCAATSTVQSGTLTLNDIQFKIPNGFTAVESDLDHSEAGDAEHMEGTQVDTEVSRDYINSNGEKLDIKVGSRANSKIDIINIAGAQKKTIAGKEGFFWTEMDDGRTEYKFEYLQDGKIVKIVTNSEDVINQVLA